MYTGNKRKIINDPVYGFIKIPFDLLYDLIEHPYFQRLRRIRQLGLTHLVYPGATHTRFQHALGTMHLMTSAVDTICSKGQSITPEESEAVHAAILLHDIGHGPFSHVLENSLVENVPHESISQLIMNRLNEEFQHSLNTALDIFNNTYSKQFLHQLVSSQLDMDRLDYLKRDSFFSGVSEGNIGSDRIIKMLTVNDDQLVVEAKGIYSIEKFLVARRLMYWQVYLHKTAIVAERMLVNILKRAKEISLSGDEPFSTPHLRFFLNQKLTYTDFKTNPEVLRNFTLLDDDDIMSAIKTWTYHHDAILSRLSQDFLSRKLYRIELQKEPFETVAIEKISRLVANKLKLPLEDVNEYFVFTDTIENNAYSMNDERIKIQYNNNELKDIADASDMFNLSILGKTDRKHYLCYPKSALK